MRVCVYVVMYRPDLYKKEYTHPMALSDPANQREHTTFSTLGISAPAAESRDRRASTLCVCATAVRVSTAADATVSCVWNIRVPNAPAHAATARQP